MNRRRRHNINYLAIARIIGFLLIVEGVFMVIPLIVSLCHHERDATAFLISTGSCFAFGLPSLLLSRKGRRDLGKREGMLLTALVWVVFSLFGMIPFIFSSLHLNVSEAFFEAMSGFTTTGVSVWSDVETMPDGLHFWRSMMQWIGGMGIIIFTVALLPMLNSSGGVQMFNAEATGITHDKISPRVSSTAKRLWTIYTFLTVALTVLFWIGPMGLMESLCHAFSTVSTGGFSTKGDSIGAWSSIYVKIVTIIFMFIGGVNFVMIYKASTGKVRQLWGDETFRAYVKIVGFVTAFFIIIIAAKDLWSNVEELIVDPLFQVVSTITSTGFTVTDFSLWGPVVFPLLFMLMFVGACAGSTSGGAKIDRMLYLWKNGRNELNKSVHPNRFYTLAVNGRASSPELLSKVFAFIFIYCLLILVGAVLLALMGLPLSDSFFASLSCVGNTGLGAGVTADSYAIVPDWGKWILSALMLIGRLEIFTVIILFTRGFWKK